MQLDPTGKWILTGRYWKRKSDGYLLRVIQGGGPANTVQNDKYAFGTDDNTEALHSLDTENTNRTAQAADVTFMFRVQIEETNGGNEVQGYQLFAQKNGTGGFIEIPYSTTNNGLRLADDTQSRADDEATTERLSYGGASSFQTGRYDDGTTAVGTQTIALDQDVNGYTDLEFALQIDSANASDNDYWELRVNFDKGTALDGYPGTYPTVTADILETPSPSVSDSVTTGESQTVQVTAPQASASDAVAVAESLGYYSETVFVSESATVEVVGGGPPTEYNVSESDGVTVGDTATLDPVYPLDISETDAVTTGEADTVEVTAVGQADISEADNVSVGDTASLEVSDPQVLESDSVTTGDTATLYIGLEIAESDAVTSGETIAIAPLVLAGVSVSDNVTLGESQNVVRQVEGVLSISEADSVSVADTASLSPAAPTEISETDAVNVGDTASVSIAVVGEINVNVSDGVNVGETTSIDPLILDLFESEGVSVGDTATLENQLTGVSVADAVTLGEATSVYLPITIAESDAVATGESIALVNSDLAFTVTDSVTLLDSPTVALTLLISQTYTVGLDANISPTISLDANPLPGVEVKVG